MTSPKKRIAIIINGGIATGHFSEGDAVITQLLSSLASTFDLIVFSLVKTDSYKVKLPFQVIDIQFTHLQNAWLRLFWLFFKILWHHLFRPFQVIHGFGAFPAGLLAVVQSKIVKKKSLVTLLGGEYLSIPEINYGLWSHKHLRPFLGFTLNHCDELVILTKTAADQIQTNLPNSKKHHTISFGIDTSLFVPTPKSLSEPYKFLHIADLNLVKNQPMLLAAFQLITKQVKAHLTIIGVDTLNGRIQKLALELGLADKITFLPRISHYYLPAFYAQAHILLHTSYSESQTMAVNEALACGVLVCGTRVGIIADLEDEITTVAAVGDAEELAQKVLHLLNDREKQEALRNKGIAWSKKNDLAAQSRKYEDLYRTLLTASN
ncbi:glycosyltransferase family 4 protein [Runella sp.]|jgi:glycosyltransferase involved in cell wall biosynthesis|uniref:glycosyltransferase family 4 protein n=1 Tax=Runella sp. TaxID=1960881 RepID=UPI00260F747F|nr:glycosyltransferase family 4 protein [Runella sp.]